MKKTLLLFGLLFVIGLVFLLYDGNEANHTTEEIRPIISEDDSLVVKYLDVGQADATVFHIFDNGKEHVVLYDTGDWQGTEVVDYLREHNIQTIDIIIISHPHADHIGQLKSIIEQYTVEEVWMTSNTTQSNLYIATIEAILNSDVTYHEPKLGDKYDIGSLEIEIIHPDESALTGDLNEDSLSILASFGDVKFLFTGDAGERSEKLMLKRNSQLEADIFRLGHHGSKTSNHLQFIQKVNPAYAIYSAGENNEYDHPSHDVLKKLSDEKIPVLGTSIHGTITVETDGQTYNITTEKNEPQHKAISHTDCIDLNRATLDELTEIIHINDVRAEHIIKLRPFKDIAELENVNGIGEKRLNDIIKQGKVCTKGD